MPAKPKSKPGSRRKIKAQDPALEQLQLILELLGAVEEVVWLRDLQEERLLYVSPGFAKIWGRSVESLLHSPRIWVESIHPQDRDRVMSAALDEGRSGNDATEYRIRRPDGTIRWVYDRCYPVRNKEGHVYRLAGVVEDISDRRKS